MDLYFFHFHSIIVVLKKIVCGANQTFEVRYIELNCNFRTIHMLLLKLKNFLEFKLIVARFTFTQTMQN